MAEIISFNEPARLKKQLEEKEAEIVRLNRALAKSAEDVKQAREQLGTVISVNELLRLQVQDLIHTMQTMEQTVQTTVRNLKNLQGRLPKF